MSDDKIYYGWHFLADDGKLGYGDGREPGPGDTLSSVAAPKLCRGGMHASTEALDALQYAPGSTVCRVAIWGEVCEGDDKIVGRNRHVLWMIDGAGALRHFACDQAERALGIEADGSPSEITDCVVAARDYANGYDVDLDAAYNAAHYAAAYAAYSAAYSAAYYAAHAAAYNAARNAAHSAAHSAAYNAARNAARNAAHSAAHAAARSAAHAAAYNAAYSAAYCDLHDLLISEAKNQGVFVEDYDPREYDFE